MDFLWSFSGRNHNVILACLSEGFVYFLETIICRFLKNEDCSKMIFFGNDQCFKTIILVRYIFFIGSWYPRWYIRSHGETSTASQWSFSVILALIIVKELSWFCVTFVQYLLSFSFYLTMMRNTFLQPASYSDRLAFDFMNDVFYSLCAISLIKCRDVTN